MSLARIDVSWSLTAVGISKAIVNNNDLSALLFPFALKTRHRRFIKKTAHTGSDGGRNDTLHYSQKDFYGKNAKLFIEM